MNDGAVFQNTARSTRVCAYDRPGTERADGSPGRSSAVAQPTSTEGDAADIHALLTSAGVPGPYVIVAHSVGGLIATTYARKAMVDYSSALLESQTLLATSLGATHVTQTNSAHDIYIENAPLVNQQICAVIGPATGC